MKSIEQLNDMVDKIKRHQSKMSKKGLVFYPLTWTELVLEYQNVPDNKLLQYVESDAIAFDWN